MSPRREHQYAKTIADTVELGVTEGVVGAEGVDVAGSDGIGGAGMGTGAGGLT